MELPDLETLVERTHDTPTSRRSKQSLKHLGGPAWKRSLEWLRGSAHAAVGDLKRLGLSGISIYTFSVLWALTLTGGWLYLTISRSIQSYSLYQDRSACRPDTSFSPFMGFYQPWKLAGFFEVTIPLGRFTFTQAKVLDVSWDLIVGRGGQAILAYSSWSIFADYVATSIVVKPITFSTFAVIFWEKGPSLTSLCSTIRDFSTRRGLRDRAPMVLIVFSMVLTLLWPTLVGAMTGYTALMESFIPTKDGTMYKFRDFVPVCFILRDGPRVGLDENFNLSMPAISVVGSDPLIDWTPGESNLPSSGWLLTGEQGATLDYINKYGLSPAKDMDTKWGMQHVAAPPLDIGAFYVPPEWTTQFNDSWNLADPNKIMYIHQNDPSITYTVEYVKENGLCQPVNGAYQWGFSFLQLFVLLTILLIWTIGILLLWVQARLRLRPLADDGTEKEEEVVVVPGGWSALLLLADTMRDSFQEAGISNPNDSATTTTTHRQLKKQIRDRLGGGAVMLPLPLPPPPPPPSDDPSRVDDDDVNTTTTTTSATITTSSSSSSGGSSLRKALRKDAWWIAGALACMGFGTLALPFYDAPGITFTWGIFAGVVAVIVLGRTNRSRLFMLACWSAGVLILTLCVVLPYWNSIRGWDFRWINEGFNAKEPPPSYY